jgi:surfeit locus 1 family protein
VKGFRPERGPTIVTLIAVLAFCGLGVWQVRRHVWRTADLAEKSARIDLPPVPLADAVRDPDAYSFRRAEIHGRFELADTVLVGPVERGMELGARVLTPMLLEGDPDGAPRVLVDRGWVSQNDTPRFLPPETPSEASESEIVEVSGLALPLAIPPADGKNTGPGSREQRHTHFPRFNPDRPGLVEKLTAQLPYALLPVMVQSARPEPGGSPIAEPARPVSPVDHLGYAFTWFAIAALSVGAWVENGRRRAREKSARES